MKKIKILITEDHTLVREMWTKFLNMDPELDVIAGAKSAEECFKLVGNCRPDIVLLDINLPGINGVDAIRQIKINHPPVKIIGVSAHTHPSYAKEMMRRGASGYMTKNSSALELLESIKAVYKGHNYVCMQTKNIIFELSLGTDTPALETVSSLSGRELEVVKLVKQGFSSAGIGETLNICRKTVEVHRYNILKKLKLKNTAALVNFINQSYFDFR